MKKITLILMVFIMITNCGYKAMYSSENFNFNIIKIEKIEENKLNLTIEKKLKNFSNNQAVNQISLQINAKKQIIIISKDSLGDPTRYQMIINLNLDIIDNQNIKTNKNIVQEFNYNTNSNKFALNQYEKEIEEILINRIINELINNLSKL
jgi:hypothetical protein